MLFLLVEFTGKTEVKRKPAYFRASLAEKIQGSFMAYNETDDLREKTPDSANRTFKKRGEAPVVQIYYNFQILQGVQSLKHLYLKPKRVNTHTNPGSWSSGVEERGGSQWGTGGVLHTATFFSPGLIP